MNGVNSPPIPHDVLPPPDPKLVLRYAYIAVALCSVAALIGLFSDASFVNRIRLLLTAAGMLTAGYALTLRPTDFRIWLLAALTALLAWPALPSQWDSMQMVARVLAVLSLAGAGLMYISPRNRANCYQRVYLFPLREHACGDHIARPATVGDGTSDDACLRPIHAIYVSRKRLSLLFTRARAIKPFVLPHYLGIE